MKKEKCLFPKVACVVVTYNRRRDLQQCLKMLRSQDYPVFEVIVVDNASTDDTADYLVKEEHEWETGRFNVLTLKKNRGGAGGFEAGVREACKNDYAYVWLMDDDGFPEDKSTLSSLMNTAQRIHSKNDLVFINALVTYNGSGLSFSLRSDIHTVGDALASAKKGMIENLVNPFNGTLVSIELIRCIGVPDGRFFIKGDETDYVRRALKAGAYVGTDCKSRFRHPALPSQYKKVFGRVRKVNTEAPWKWYYRVRNYVYMEKRDNGSMRAVYVGLRSVFDGIAGGVFAPSHERAVRWYSW